MFQLINDAWDVLKEDDKRAEYTKMWRIWQKEKLQPMERAELARKEGRGTTTRCGRSDRRRSCRCSQGSGRSWRGRKVRDEVAADGAGGAGEEGR